MSKAAFVPEAVPALVAVLRGRAAELTPHLDGVDDFIDALSKRKDKSSIDLKTLHMIAKKKSRRRAELVWKNDPKVVEQITELAFAIDDDLKPLQLLCVLDGVNVPTASSILSWLFPEKWPVIDQRAWRTLQSAGVVTTRPSGTALGVSQWRVYLPAVRTLQAQLDGLAKTPQQVDRLLYGLDVLGGGQA